MRILVVTLALLLLGSGPASACFCGSEPLQYWFDLSDVVFSGIVTSMEPGSLFDPTRYELTVTGCWKGVSEYGSVMVVVSDGPWSSCNFNEAAVGEEWVIYATFAGAEGFYTDDCRPNEQLPLAPAHAAFLGPSSCGPVSVEEETWGNIKVTYR